MDVDGDVIKNEMEAQLTLPSLRRKKERASEPLSPSCTAAIVDHVTPTAVYDGIPTKKSPRGETVFVHAIPKIQWKSMRTC